MSRGLYIHIPFCRKACRYCDFYFSVALKQQDVFTAMLLREIELSARELGKEEGGRPRLSSLYIGGGTPSVLSGRNLSDIVKKVEACFQLLPAAERTMECNPDDLNQKKLDNYYKMGFTRLSVGIQSFSDRDLELMRRTHNSAQAIMAIENATSAGFENISIDLIYGIPGQDLSAWRENLFLARDLPVQHISAYHLSFEEGTVFDYWRKKGRIRACGDEVSESFYLEMRALLLEAGFEHYEISNFSLARKRSEHNQLYWSGRPYLGLGPSAHAYDGQKRSWNPASVKKYIEGLQQGRLIRFEEQLSLQDYYHDYLITSLRTSRGMDPGYIVRQFDTRIARHFTRETAMLKSRGLLLQEEDRLRIAPEKWLLTDLVLRSLFL